MTDHERDDAVEDLDVTRDDAEDVRGGCQNNLAQAAPAAAARATKIEAINVKQQIG